MRIKRLSTTHFRNLGSDTISFSPGVNLLVGDNGQGKTNVLEALSLFKFGRSLRTGRDTDTVGFSEHFCRVEVTVEYGTGDSEVFSASIERSGAKRVKVGDKEVPKLSTLVGQYPCVVFGPQDLGLVSGAPAERRRFLDMTGSMTDRGYLEGLRAYRRVLTQRNAFLKSSGAEAARDVWNEELVKYGCDLIAKRIDLVDSLARHLRSHIGALGVRYPITVAYESDLTENVPETVSREEHFTARLAGVEEEEARRRTTLVGPHRDDVRFVLEDRDIRRFGSQGQRRLLAVLLRLAELAYLEERLGEPCVLLLDDLFSELDHDVGEKLQRLLDGERQIFVTSPLMMQWDNNESPRVYRINNGSVVA